MKTFETHECVSDMSGCMKRPIVVHAKQINEDFRVNTLEGDYKQGKAGDYLMRGIEGELYICDKVIFEKSYGWVEHKMNTSTIEEVRKSMAECEKSVATFGVRSGRAVTYEALQAFAQHFKEEGRKELHPILFDGYEVFVELDAKASARTSAANVSDVLDAVVRLIRNNTGE